MRLLITGGLGFVGLHLLRLVLRERPEWTVQICDDETVGQRDDLAHILDREFGSAKETIERDRLRITQCDVRDAERVADLAGDCDAVVHLASRTSVQLSMQNPGDSLEVSMLGTLNVLEACRAKGISRVVLASSNAAAGEQSSEEAGESNSPKPISPYGAGKSCLEALASAYWRSYGVETVCLRFANVYGPYSHRKSSVIAKWIGRVLQNEAIEVFGNGDQTRDFLYANDTARAMLLSLETPNIGAEVLQIGSGVETTVSELAQILGEISGRDVKVVNRPPLPGEIYRVSCDVSKAQSLLGLTDLTPLSTGLKETWAWFEQRNAIA